MDKYEFNIKAEQIKKLTAKGDYDTAMRIADTIDWRRVRNTNLLSLVSQIYEKNEDYREAKDILLLAFERAPVGKRLLYKLSELSLKEHNVEEAEEFYREFCDLAPEDPRQHLLRYLILKERRAPMDQLIHSLERYTALELDEKWLYELAELYHKAGMDGDCVRVCDKIMLMFGLGKYVEKAMDLKIQHAPLNSYQMDLVENRDKYEEKLRAVEQGMAESAPTAEEGGYMGQQIPPLEPEEAPMGLGDAALADLLQEEQIPVAAPTPMTVPQMQPAAEYIQEQPAAAPPIYAQVHPYYGYQASSTPLADTQPVPIEPEPMAVWPQAAPASSQVTQADDWQAPSAPRAWFSSASYAGPPADPWPHLSAQPSYNDVQQSVSGRPMDEELIATVKVAEAEEQLAQELSKMSPEGQAEQEEDEFHKTRVLRSIKEVIPPHVLDFPAVGKQLPPAEGLPCPADMGADSPFIPEPVEAPGRTVSVEMEPDLPQKEPEPTEDAAEVPLAAEADLDTASNHLMIESRDPQKGLELALNTLKQIHRETGSHNSVAKISAKKLNHKGLLTVSQQLEGKDLVIQDAGDLSEVLATELEHWMGMETGRRVVILIDNPMQLERLHNQYPALSGLFECIGDGEEPEEKEPEVKELEARKPDVGEEERKPKAKRHIKPIKQDSSSLEKPDLEKPATEKEEEKKASKRKLRTDVRPVVKRKSEPEPEEDDLDIPAVQIEEPPVPPEPLEEELPEEEPEVPEEQMDIDEFAQYACKYAKEIDCSITGKSMLALYERIEIMEEEGVPLTASNAEELIEEAADKAEKPSLLRLLTGMFTPKYDKDDYLILREEHFI